MVRTRWLASLFLLLAAMPAMAAQDPPEEPTPTPDPVPSPTAPEPAPGPMPPALSPTQQAPRAAVEGGALAEGRWYGWELMLIDAAAVTLVFVPVADDWGPVTRGIGMTTLLLAPPGVHMLHRNPRSASVSLARLPMLLLGRLLGSALGAAFCNDIPCQDTGTLVGSIVGIAPVMLFDWAYARRPARLFYAGNDPRAKTGGREPLPLRLALPLPGGRASPPGTRMLVPILTGRL